MTPAEKRRRAIDLGNELCDRCADEETMIALAAAGGLIAQLLVERAKPGVSASQLFATEFRPMLEEIIRKMERGAVQ